MYEHFVKSSKNFIESINETGLMKALSKYNIDEGGPVCSDGELMNMFRVNLDNPMDDLDLYSIIEKTCMDYCYSFY